MNAPNKPLLWIGWAAITFMIGGYLAYRLRSPDRTAFLPGRTTHGHYQIEMACNACHTPMMGVKEQSCIDCHGAQLKAANDSHPKGKFTDPRNADRLKVLDAANCVTCHREHAPEITNAMGVTVPDDYCYDCHQQTVQERPSHRGMGFTTCATSGCHNYHDNTALYEDFLLKHLHEPETNRSGRVPTRNLAEWVKVSGRPSKPALAATRHDGPAATNPALVRAWGNTAHARGGVNCTDCHAGTADKRWTDHLDHTACATCHKDEVNGFFAGRHGMRLAQNLSPMTPAMARLPMKSDAAHRELNCVSCHGPHEFDARRAAVEACLSCHDDSHSRAYRQSSHFALWQAEVNGEAAAGSGVSCATCHMPREQQHDGDFTRVLVQHNQNANLRPNEKMIRTLCLNCHGLSFTLDALADRSLIDANFAGRPSRHVESLDLAERRHGSARQQHQQTQQHEKSDSK